LLYSAGGETLSGLQNLLQQELRLLITHLENGSYQKTYCSEINASELTADKIIANPNCSPFKWSWFLPFA
jgi:hypothetical protein